MNEMPSSFEIKGAGFVNSALNRSDEGLEQYMNFDYLKSLLEDNENDLNQKM